MPNIGTPELIIILLVVVLIFGSAKLPQLARSLGKSARILKAETKGLRGDDDDEGGAQADAADTAPAKAAPAKAAPSDPPPAPGSAGERAARLRAEAARLEREEAADQARHPREQGALPSGEPIEGVPVADYNARKTS